MEDATSMAEWISSHLMFSMPILVSVTTMVATIVLACFTFVLARETKRLASASTEPFVTATIHPNIWSMVHCDFVVANSGTAPAYDVAIDISPEPSQHTARGESEAPLRKLSILPPGQELKSFLSDVEDVLHKEFEVTITWKRSPNGPTTEPVVYYLSIPKGVSRLGAWSPEIQIAEAIKRIQEDWNPVAQGSRKLKVDVFDQEDRENERRAWEERRTELRRIKRSSDERGQSE